MSTDVAPEGTPGCPAPPSRPPVTDISQWVERYAQMAAVITTRFPHKAPELFGYLATVVKAERNYEAGRWVMYDRLFRQRALAWKDLNWSVIDIPLFNDAFAGRAKSIPCCSICLRDDHLANGCPQYGPAVAPLAPLHRATAVSTVTTSTPHQPPRTQEGNLQLLQRGQVQTRSLQICPRRVQGVWGRSPPCLLHTAGAGMGMLPLPTAPPATAGLLIRLVPPLTGRMTRNWNPARQTH